MRAINTLTVIIRVQHCICAAFLLLCSLVSLAQPGDAVIVQGKVVEGMVKLKGVRITVFKGTEPYDVISCREGTFYFELPFGADYELHFSRRNYVTKKISVLTSGVDEAIVRSTQQYQPWEVVLFQKMHGVEYPEMDKIFGSVFFDFERREFDWDKEYSKQVEKKLHAIKKREKQKMKEIERIEKVFAKASEFVEKHKDENEVVVEQYPPRAETDPDINLDEFDMEEIEKGLAEITKELENDALQSNLLDIDEIFDLFNPLKITVEYSGDARREIEIRRVTRGSKTDEYWKVKHRWGGVFYFKNGRESDQNAWQREARGK